MFFIILLILSVLGFAAYGAICIVNPDTAEALKNGFGCLFHTSKSRLIHVRYRDPRTGKELDIDAVSIPGKVPELHYRVNNGNQRLYPGDNTRQQKRISK